MDDSRLRAGAGASGRSRLAEQEDEDDEDARGRGKGKKNKLSKKDRKKARAGATAAECGVLTARIRSAAACRRPCADRAHALRSPALACARSTVGRSCSLSSFLHQPLAAGGQACEERGCVHRRRRPGRRRGCGGGQGVRGAGCERHALLRPLHAAGIRPGPNGPQARTVPCPLRLPAPCASPPSCSPRRLRQPAALRGSAEVEPWVVLGVRSSLTPQAGATLRSEQVQDGGGCECDPQRERQEAEGSRGRSQRCVALAVVAPAMKQVVWQKRVLLPGPLHSCGVATCADSADMLPRSRVAALQTRGCSARRSGWARTQSRRRAWGAASSAPSWLISSGSNHRGARKMRGWNLTWQREGGELTTQNENKGCWLVLLEEAGRGRRRSSRSGGGAAREEKAPRCSSGGGGGREPAG